MPQIGYKFLRADGSSLIHDHGKIKYPLPRDGQPGEWVDVPGNGSYVAVSGGLLDGLGPLLVRVEGEGEVFPDGPCPEGVQCFRRVRVLEVVDHVAWPDGGQEWYREGKLHRVEGPAVIRPDGTQIWYRNGKLHREGGPAIEGPDGSRWWFRRGKLHRSDGPAIVRADGTRDWYRKGRWVPPPSAEVRNANR